MSTKDLPEQWLGATLGPRQLTLCPELRLLLLSDDVDLHKRVAEVFAIDTAPYWAFCWGSGQALARYVLDHPELVRGRVVADFGAGCGVQAIAAMRAGAKAAVAVDIDPHALVACQSNAALNEVELQVSLTMPSDYDVLLASDVLYEVGNRQLIEDQLARGRTVLVSDPLRFGNPRLSLEPCHEYEVRTMPDVDYPVHRAVIYHFAP